MSSKNPGPSRVNPSGWWSRPREGSAAPFAVALNFFLALLLFTGALTFAFLQLQHNWNWEAVWNYRQKFWNGWWTTVALSAVALLTSTLTGALCAAALRSRVLFLSFLARIYVEVIRGTPLLVQILVFFYIISNSLGLSDRYAAGVIILSVFAGAYMAEIIRGGLDAIPQTQLESASAIGLSPAQTYRFVILPQTIQRILPAMTGQFVSLIKDSSLLSVIGISEFTLSAREVNNYTFSTFESFLPLAIGYLILTLPLSIWSRRLEEKWRYET